MSRAQTLFAAISLAVLALGSLPAGASDCSEATGAGGAEADRCLEQRVRRLEDDLRGAVVAFEAIACPAGWIEFVPKKGAEPPRGPLLDLPLIVCRRL